VLDGLKPRAGARDSRKGQDPGTAVRRAGLVPRHREERREKRYAGRGEAETLRQPFERGNLRRANPRSAAGVKKNRQGIEGRKPPRG